MVFQLMLHWKNFITKKQYMKDKTGDANTGDNNNTYRKLDKLQVINTLILAIATLGYHVVLLPGCFMERDPDF
jgi:hypothetical protein